MYDAWESPSEVRAKRWLPRWYEWVAAIVVSLAAIVYLVILPTTEIVVRGLGNIFSAAAAGFSVIAEQAHATTCNVVEQDPQVALLFNGPVTCAPLSATRWHDTHGRQELEFDFTITGEQGAQGEARAVVTLDELGMHLQSLVVTGPDESILVPVLP